MFDRRALRCLLLLFIFAGVVRVGWVSLRYCGEPGSVLSYPDEEAYYMSARSLASGEGLVDEFGYRATYMPGYPVFLALFHSAPEPLFWARILQALLGALAAPATYLLACRWIEWVKRGLARTAADGTIQGDDGGEGIRPAGISGVGMAAGLAVGLDPFLIYFSGLLLTETLFTTALLFAWLFVLPLSERGCGGGFVTAILAGVMLLICVLLKPAAAILVILVPAVIVLYRRFDGVSVGAGLLILFVVVVGLFPWAYRNNKIIGQWCWLTTRGGISLYDGLREGATGASDLAHTKSMPEIVGMSETEWDSYFRERAGAAAGQNPARVIKLGAHKFLRMWNLRPNVEPHRRGLTAVVSVGWMVLVFVFGAVGWWRHRGFIRQWFMLLLPVIAFTLLHCVFVASVRYRVPLMPMILILSGTGFMGVFGRKFSGRERVFD